MIIRLKNRHHFLVRYLPRRARTKRVGYFAMALVVLLSVLSYSLIFKSVPKVKAATIGTSSQQSSGNAQQRHMVTASNGTIVAFYLDSSSSFVFSKSTDNGATWSAATTIVSGGGVTNDFSVAIDGGDNIYTAESQDCLSTCFSLYSRKLSYVSASNSWTVGSANTVALGSSCQSGSVEGDTYTYPTITITSTGKVWINTLHGYYDDLSGCIGPYTDMKTYSSANLSSWTQNSVNFNVGSGETLGIPIVADGSSLFATDGSSLKADINGSGAWSDVATWSNLGLTDTAAVLSLDKLFIFYENSSSQLAVVVYDITTGSVSSPTVISSATNDKIGTIVTDTQNVWAVYSSYVAANSYNVVYKRYDGSSWDVSATGLTADNLNNLAINTPSKVGNTANLPVMWSTGTSNPFTIKATAFSNTGSVTDSGNQTGSFTGILTGNSGDVVVKCGVWYYNTINIVAGMTIKICANNGQVGGSLELHANSVTVAGTIDGAGRGFPGGITISAKGGALVSGGNNGTTAGGNGSPGQNGKAGSPAVGGGAGAGSYGVSGGSAGTSGAGGIAGSAGVGVPVTTTGGGHGTGGTGGSIAGSAAGLGGYAAAGTNGDVSTDESVALGSGGGAGGTGGAGGSGGSGGGGAMNTVANPATDCAGIGGSSGAGADGGTGGKGGNGGASLKIYSSGTLSVTGTILATGQAGNNGGVASSGANGTAGVPGTTDVCAQ